MLSDAACAIDKQLVSPHRSLLDKAVLLRKSKHRFKNHFRMVILFLSADDNRMQRHTARDQMNILSVLLSLQQLRPWNERYQRSCS